MAEQDDAHGRDGMAGDGGAHGAAAEPGRKRRGRPKSAAGGPEGDRGDGGTVIKKYANRRLYDTTASRYVTLEDLAAMVREGRHFTVIDAKSGDDITRSVLGQIIFEQESKDGPSLLPTEFLRQVISYYGDNIGAVVPSYLEASMRAFEKGAEDMREEMTRMAGGTLPDPARMVEAGMAGFAAPLRMIEEQTRRNQEAFMGAMRMFTPFGGAMPSSPKPAPAKSAPPKSAPPPAGSGERADGHRSGTHRSDELAALREQIAAMQRKVDDLGS